MANARALLVASLSGLAATAVLGTLAAAKLTDWMGPTREGHEVLAIFGFLMPGLAFLHWQVAGVRMPRALPDPQAIAFAWLTGAALVAADALGFRSGWIAAAGSVVLFAAAILQTIAVMKAAPRRGETVVDVAKDPLTKGDDASLKHVRFAHMVFLPLSMLGLTAAALASAAGVDDGWVGSLRLASMHWLLAGYGLLSVYGLSHLVIPRFSGVPAIAAGAIKGELHSSLLGLVLLAAGFLLPQGVGIGFLVAGGAFLFLGAFTFMGVLGANIMKNKSPTQRVTPQFAYVPWTFAGVFWLIAGVLLGLFINAARFQVDSGNFPEGILAALSFIHVHAALLGGFAMLLLAFATRLLATARGQSPAPFSRTKWSFYGLNVAILAMGYGALRPGPALFWGSLLATLSLAAWFISLLPSSRSPGGRA